MRIDQVRSTRLIARRLQNKALTVLKVDYLAADCQFRDIIFGIHLALKRSVKPTRMNNPKRAANFLVADHSHCRIDPFAGFLMHGI